MSVISDTIYHDNDSVNLPSIPPLTGMITITTRRTRPTSAIRMTPDSKRHKPMLEEEEEATRLDTDDLLTEITFNRKVIAEPRSHQ